MSFLVISTQDKSVAMKRLCVGIGVRVSDIRYCNEDFEWVLFIWLTYASLDFAPNFCFPLLAVAVIGEDILYQLDEVREGEGMSAHLLKPSSFL